MTWSFNQEHCRDDTGATGLKFKARLNVRGDQRKDADVDPDHHASKS